MVNQSQACKNMRLIAYHDLDGFGNCGEGLALKQLPDGRRILFIAHLDPPKDFTVLDVTNPANPSVILQTDLPHQEVRSNSLALVGDILVVAYQVTKPGLKPAGMGVYDVSDVTQPKRIGFFDTSGPDSRGVHCLWFVDGRYAHLSTGMPDFAATHPKDDQCYVIVDLADPSSPSEVGRWWLPGTRQGDSEAPPKRHTQFDSGFRVHNANVYPQRPDRAYLGYIDGGAIILDISDMSRPTMVSRIDYHPPFPGFTHTVMPLFDRNLLIVTDESVRDECLDWPKMVWVMDMREESNPVIISTFPLPPKSEYCRSGVRCGAHNIHENEPIPTAWFSDRFIVGTFFNAGVRVYDIADPFRPEEVAYYVPQSPPGQPAVRINDVFIDERGLIYAVDRLAGGLFILELQCQAS